MKKLKPAIVILTILALSVSLFLYNNNPEMAGASWWNDSWNYRKALTINSDQVAGNLTDFPVLVSLTDTNLSNHAQDDGDDFIFIDSEGKKLSHEIESYASSTGVLVAWVRLPSLSSTADTDIFMYYGNAGIESQQDGENVWDENFKMVQHLNEDGTGTRYDSTLNNNDGTTVSYEGDEATTTAKINGADSFNGVDEWVEVADSDTLSFTDGNKNDKAFTLSAWVNFSTSTAEDDANAIVAKYLDSSPFLGEWEFSVEEAVIGGSGSNKLYGQVLSDSSLERLRFQSDNEVPLNQWSYVSFTYDGSETVGGGKIYLNVSDVTTYTDNPGGHDGMSNRSSPVQIGASITDTPYDGLSEGTIDEVRISNIVRSIDWIQTEYNNQNNPASFFAESAEEVGPGPVGYWSFDEGYGTTAHDESSNKNDGTITGAAWKGEDECIVGKCLWFDGEELTVVHADVQDNMDEFTACTWFKANSFTNVDSDSQVQLLDKDWFLRITNSGMLEFGMTTSGSYPFVSSNRNLNLNEWYHTCVEYNGIGVNPVLYVNGLDVSGISSGGNGTRADDSGDELLIGASDDYARNFYGYIDEVKIYPYARTTDQVKQDYNAGLSGVKSTRGSAVSFGGASDSWMSDGLVGYWKMDETTGTWDGTADEVVDSSGAGNHGIAVGTASTTGGKYGAGGVFDGNSDYIDIDSFSSDSLSHSFCFWINRVNEDYVFDGVFPIEANRLQIGLGANSCNSNLCVTEGANQRQLDTTIPTNEWHNVCVVLDSDKNLAIGYLDGEESGNDYYSGFAPSSPSEVAIGGRFSGGSYYFDGMLDEFRIYNRALSKSEVRKLYEWAPGPVMHLKMDEKSGQDVNDNSGNENSGTLGINTLVGSEDPSRVRGKYGSALSFDGANDTVNIGDPVDLQLTGAMTVSTWIKPMENVFARFVSKRGATPQRGYNFDITAGASNPTVEFSITPDGTAVVASGVTQELNQNEWYYVTGVFNPGVAVQVFVNGVLANEDITDIPPSQFNSNNQVRVGSGVGGATSKSYLDDVKIYNYARTQKQILEDMNGGGPASKMPVLHLSFDEGRGGTAYDSSIYKNNGIVTPTGGGTNTTVSSMWEKNGKKNGAMEFDGVDDYVEVSTPVVTSAPFTLCTWFKADQLATDKGDELQLFMISDNSGTQLSDWNWFAMRIDDGAPNENKLQINARQGFTLSSAESTIAITANKWHFACYVASADDKREVYLDAGNNAVDTTTVTPLASDLTQTNIGRERYGDSASANYFDGIIDEAKIWNYALTIDEIKDEYNSGGAIVMGGGNTEADDNGSVVTGASVEYCIPGDTSKCSPPVLELKMDKKSGSTAYDTSGNGNDGTIVGATHGRGKKGAGLEFDGMNDYVEVEYDSKLAPTTEISVSMWAYMDDWTDLNSMDYPEFIAKAEAGGYTIIADDSSTVGSNNIGFVVRRNGVYGDAEITTASLSSGWHYFYGTYDGRYIRFFVDGVIVDTDDAGANYPIQYSVNNPLCISADADTSTSDCLNTHNVSARIDDVKIYDYDRTPAQIAWDYNKGKPIAHYKFDECSGSTIHDESGNGNHGTLNLGASDVTTVGTCASSSNSFWWNGKDGKKNGGGSFDGGDDYIDIGDTNYDINSISFWLKQDYTDTNIFDLDDGTHAIAVSNNQASAVGFSSPSIYIDGENRSAIPDNSWHHVLVTTATAIDVNNFDIGRIATNYFTGQIDEVKLYNYVLTSSQAKTDFSGGAVGFGYSGIQNGSALVSSWSCGDTLVDSRDSKNYATILIGSQCWMAQGLNIGTRINGGSGQTDNATFEKYCYDNSNANCDSNNNPNYPDGGLYQWNEAMQYASACNGTGEGQPACATPVQGMCPDEWHLPSHYEIVALEREVCTSGTCVTDFPYDESTTLYRGTDEGTKLKPNGTSGFEGNIAGRYESGFVNRGSTMYLWSSTENSSSAWNRYLVNVASDIFRNYRTKTSAFSIRCVKD